MLAKEKHKLDICTEPSSSYPRLKDAPDQAAKSPSPVASIYTLPLKATKPALFETMIASIVSSDDISTAANREKNNTLAPDSVTIRS